jgi:rhodanese-related sulfurtransferase
MNWRWTFPFDNHLVVVDVRKEPEFADGHVKDAVNLPLNNLVDPGSYGQYK